MHPQADHSSDGSGRHDRRETATGRHESSAADPGTAGRAGRHRPTRPSLSEIEAQRFWTTAAGVIAALSRTECLAPSFCALVLGSHDHAEPTRLVRDHSASRAGPPSVRDGSVSRGLVPAIGGPGTSATTGSAAGDPVVPGTALPLGALDWLPESFEVILSRFLNAIPAAAASRAKPPTARPCFAFPAEAVALVRPLPAPGSTLAAPPINF